VPEGQHYEAGRVADVLMFGANECLKDDGQSFSCDITPHGRRRRVYTQRDPLLGVISAITPFNHPMNQVAHKVVPAVATNNRMVLKPSEKVPLSALLLADILYEAGLPPEMLSVVTGDPREIADEMLTHPAVDLITFTGGVAIGKYIASQGRLPAHGAGAGRQRPDHRDGRRRPRRGQHAGGAGFVQELRPALHGRQAHAGAREAWPRFTDLVVDKTRAWKHGDPADPKTEMGTVIDEAAARLFEPAWTRPWRRARGCWPATSATARCTRPP
jgi:acyl-CoA reductase-like NAD-dependent aldehyde dehydrogenase